MPNPQITFVCCVELGSLEAQTVRMIESLRRWGGQFANATVFAVTLRFYCRSMSEVLQYSRARQESEYKKLCRVI